MEQGELVEVFRELRGMLKEYEGKLRPKFDLEGRYDLWSFKDVEIAGRRRREVSFATIIIQSSYVGLYYMPIYIDTELADVFGPELLSTLKGKSCFHVRRLDPELREQVERALRIGYELYERRGWV
jgi:hypothetical protein